jgi:hypothetical protein
VRAGEECARREEGEERLGGRLRDQARPHPRPYPGDLEDTEPEDEGRKADKAGKVTKKREKAEAARKTAVGSVFGEKDAAPAAEVDNDVTVAVTG